MSYEASFSRSFLGREVQELATEIEDLSLEMDSEHFCHQAIQRNAAIVTMVAETELSDNLKRLVVNTVATRSLEIVMATPRVIREMISKLDEGAVPRAMQCALVAVLAYFVRRQDLIPDDSPGGYGYVDDSIVLRAGAVVWRARHSADNANARTDEQRTLGILYSCVPSDVLNRCWDKVRGVATIFRVLAGLPEGVVVETYRDLLKRPHEAKLPDVESGDSEDLLLVPRPDGLKLLVNDESRRGVASEIIFPGGSRLVIKQQDLLWSHGRNIARNIELRQG